MQGLEPLFRFMDHLFGFVFLLPSDPMSGFLVGLFWAALVATVIGELCMFGAYWLNRRHFRKLGRDMVEQHNLSLQALGAKDKESYKACNAQANDSFGKSFFSGITLFAASIWPAFLVMAWLAARFKGFAVELPLVGREAGASFFFVPVYIIVRILFHKSKPVLPLFRTMQKKVKDNEAGEQLLTFADIVKTPEETQAEREAEEKAAASKIESRD